MDSLINMKVWKKFINHFHKKKKSKITDNGNLSCKINESMNSLITSHPPDKEISYERLSTYSLDSLDEKNFNFVMYLNNGQIKTKSISEDSLSPSFRNGISFSEDSLQSLDSLCKTIKNHNRKPNRSFRIKVNNLCTKPCQPLVLSRQISRSRSYSVGDSSSIHKTTFSNQKSSFFNTRSLIFIPTITSSTLSIHEGLSIDSLEDNSNERKLAEQIGQFNKDIVGKEGSNINQNKSFNHSFLHETIEHQNLMRKRETTNHIRTSGMAIVEQLKSLKHEYDLKISKDSLCDLVENLDPKVMREYLVKSNQQAKKNPKAYEEMTEYQPKVKQSSHKNKRLEYTLVQNINLEVLDINNPKDQTLKKSIPIDSFDASSIAITERLQDNMSIDSLNDSLN